MHPFGESEDQAAYGFAENDKKSLEGAAFSLTIMPLKRQNISIMRFEID